jgi:hypothetical protein
VTTENPFALRDAGAYARWRDWKLARQPRSSGELMVEIGDPFRLTAAERDAILDRCRRANMALYTLRDGDGEDKEAIRALGRQLGLERLDSNLGADEDSITSLRVVEGDRRTGYIPYTNRRLSWHTDGYYNRPEQQIRAILMHCVRTAAEGGANVLMDHEMLYIQLRDADPAYVEALMQADAMTIPPNEEGGEAIREARSGPVFSRDARTGNLHMRYTARTRSIEWKEDAVTREAVDLLGRLLEDADSYRFEYRLDPGQGIICNNVLHCRTSFADDAASGRQRLLYRARYYDRIDETAMADLGWQGN